MLFYCFEATKQLNIKPWFLIQIIENDFFFYPISVWQLSWYDKTMISHGNYSEHLSSVFFQIHYHLLFIIWEIYFQIGQYIFTFSEIPLLGFCTVPVFQMIFPKTNQFIKTAAWFIFFISRSARFNGLVTQGILFILLSAKFILYNE